MEFSEFWGKVPGEAIIMMAVFIGATIRSLRTQAVGLKSALYSLLLGIAGGTLAALIASDFFNLNLKSAWYIGLIGGYLGSLVWEILDRVVEPLTQDPWKLLIRLMRSGLSDLLDRIATLTDKSKNNQPPE